MWQPLLPNHISDGILCSECFGEFFHKIRTGQNVCFFVHNQIAGLEAIEVATMGFTKFNVVLFTYPFQQPSDGAQRNPEDFKFCRVSKSGLSG